MGEELLTGAEHELLIFFAQLAALLLAARVLGLAARKVGQPAIVGELMAGLLLGPSIFGKLAPEAQEWLFPNALDSRSMLLAISSLGVVLLLVVTGYETDLDLIRTLGKPALFVTAGSIVVPFAAGLLPGMALPAQFVGLEADRSVFALFIAAALTTSSLAVVAKILAELKLLRRNFGQITLAVGMGNEIVGYVILGVIASIAASGRLSPRDAAGTLFGILAFVAISLTLGQKAVDAGFRRLRGVEAAPTTWLAVTLILTFFAGAVTQGLGAEAVLGAFVVGVITSRSRYREPATREQLEGFTYAFLAPLFFATAGLQVDIGVLADPTVLFWGAVLLAVAWGAKFGGVVLASVLVGLEKREAVALGVGLNARGVLEVLIATVGLSLGVFNRTSYSLVLLTAIVSATLAPAALRAVASGWSGTTAERDRLDREERLEANLLVRTDRVLVPTRGGPNSRLAALLIHQAWPTEAGMSLVSVADSEEPPDLSGLIASLDGREIDHRVTQGDNAAAAISDQSLLGYGAIAVGATSAATSGRLLSPVLDDLLASSRLPLVVVRRGPHAPENSAGRFRRVVIPVSGTLPSRAAQEIGLALAATHSCPVVLLHVVGSDDQAVDGSRRTPVANRRPGLQKTLVAQRVLDEALANAQRSGIDATGLVREAASPGPEIVETAEEIGADLIVIGGTLRPLEGRPFVGHNAEYILDHASATVVVVAAPRDWAVKE